MPSFNLTVPGPIKTINLATSPTPKKGGDQEGYDDGFAAGYRSGMIASEHESKKTRQTESELFKQVIAPLSSCRDNYIQLLQHELPELLGIALERLFAKNPFSEEAIKAEVECMVRQLTEAKSITVECSVQALGILQEHMESGGSVAPATALAWKSNPDFKSGDFRIHSDLGSFDGRTSTRLAHVRDFLKATSETETIATP